MSSVICGIDPGISGGIAFLNVEGNSIWSDDLPTTQVQGVGKKWLDATALGAMMQNFSPDACALERVSSRPGQGLSSTFRFGMAFGQCLGVLAALQVPIWFVTPGKWKRDVGLPAPPTYLTKSQAASYRKNAALDLAKEIFPASVDDFARKKDHNRAEAALLAYWGVRNGIRDMHDMRK
jgi:hypothetical protein